MGQIAVKYQKDGNGLQPEISTQQQHNIHNTTGTIEEAYSKAHLNHKLKTHSTKKEIPDIETRIQEVPERQYPI